MITPEAELAGVMEPFGRTLDDQSPAFVARLRAEGFVGDGEWARIKTWLREAMEIVTGPNRTVFRDGDGRLVLDANANPRNANWLRIAAVHRLTERRVPGWAAVWLWRLHGDDESSLFWRRVRAVAEQPEMGIEPVRDRWW